MSKSKKKGSVFGKNIKDQVINIALLVVLIVVSLSLINDYRLLFGANQKELLPTEEVENVLEEPEEEKKEFTAPIVDVEDWKVYSNSWYGFEIKYPSNWSGPYYQKYQNNSKWEYKYTFRDQADLSKKTGFEIVVYNQKRVSNLTEVDEYPPLKGENDCYWENHHLPSSHESQVRQFFVPDQDENCQQAFFFETTRNEEQGSYIIILKPLFDQSEEPDDLRERTKNDLPELFGVSSSFKPVDMKRPTPEEIARANAPLPVKFKWENGRRVCSKDNDKPKKSKKNKDHHLDMECCLDPDEDPNPHCYYPPEKYGDLLN